MVDFLKKRLQVFVSSTFTDLKEERQAAVEAILAAGHIPAGMELFTAGDESQMEVIKQWIDESDVYLLILGGRYGSIEPKSGKSYTQLEYEYALALGKPLFACVMDESSLEKKIKKHGKSVFEGDNPQKLRDFRSEVLGRMVRFWGDIKDIKIAVAEKLSEFVRREDLNGWVRPSSANVSVLANEIARLSKENSDLRAELSRTEDGNSMAPGFEGLKRLLIAKDLLDVFAANHLALFEGTLVGSDNPFSYRLAQLGVIGLVEKGGGAVGSDGIQIEWFLTKLGRDFLNRLSTEELKSTS
jgi:nucleoside 2-deoxyribosyltransferase